VCPACQPSEDTDFAKIHNVMAREPGLNAQQVAAKAEVELDCVVRMLNEGRLQLQDLSEKPRCGRCGAEAISMSKRLCDRCLVELDRECLEAMTDLRDRLPEKAKWRGLDGDPGAGVLQEKREEMEKKHKVSASAKRASELEERLRPSKKSGEAARRHMVARDLRDQPKRGGK